MERWIALTAVILAAGAALPCIVFFVRALYQFVLMLGHRRGGIHGLLANMLPIFAPLMPHAYTKQGNLHRCAFLINLNRALVFALACAGALAVAVLFGDLPSPI